MPPPLPFRNSRPRLAARAAGPASAGVAGLLLVFLLCGCALQPVKPRHYRPEGEGRWAQGLHLVASRTRPLDFTTAFVEIAHNSLSLGSRSYRPISFLVIATNLSSDTLTVDPAGFRAVLAERDSALAALDPELVIRDAHARMTNEERRWMNEEATRAVFSLLDVTVQAAAAFSGREETEAEAEKRRELDESIARNEAEALRRHERTLSDAAAVKARWSDEALRKTTLLPGQKAWGLVNFANEGWLDLPRGLVLQYRATGTEGVQDLARYGMVEDTLPAPAAPAPAKASPADARPAPVFNKP